MCFSSEGDFEICVFGVQGESGGFCIFYAAGKRIVEVADAGVDIFGIALSEKLDSVIEAIADITGQIQSSGDAVGCESEADTLNRTCKDYLFCNHK